MNTIIAYILVIILSQFCITAGALVSFLLSLLFFWVHDKIRVPICTIIGGISGPLLAVGLAYLIFKWLVGSNSFSLAPFLAVTIPLIIPIYNDFKKARKMIAVHMAMPERVANFALSGVSAAKMSVLGEIIGTAIAVVLFFF